MQLTFARVKFRGRDIALILEIIRLEIFDNNGFNFQIMG